MARSFLALTLQIPDHELRGAVAAGGRALNLLSVELITMGFTADQHSDTSLHVELGKVRPFHGNPLPTLIFTVERDGAVVAESAGERHRVAAYWRGPEQGWRGPIVGFDAATGTPVFRPIVDELEREVAVWFGIGGLE